MEDCSGGGERRGRPLVAVVTRQGGGCDVRHNLLARMVPGIGALVLAGCLSPRWELLATNWPQLPQCTSCQGPAELWGLCLTLRGNKGGQATWSQPLLWAAAPGPGP